MTNSLTLLPNVPKLIAFDLDSTLIENEGINEFAKEFGVFSQVSEITERAMKGDLNFESSFTQRLSFLKGLTQSHIDNVLKRIKITDDAIEVMNVLKKNNFKIALLSGGFHCIADPVAEKLKIDFIFANQFEMNQGVATGNYIPPLIDSKAKAEKIIELTQTLNISLSQTVAVGDGANDIPMFQTAEIGISFNGKPKVEEAADFKIRGKSLLPLLKVLSLS